MQAKNAAKKKVSERRPRKKKRKENDIRAHCALTLLLVSMKMERI
jgi:hypothetical protein